MAKSISFGADPLISLGVTVGSSHHFGKMTFCFPNSRSACWRAISHSWNQWYELITWPGAIAYNGDMGSFMFRRTDDMFDFFRPRDGKLGINSGYWAEKCVAESIFGTGIREWSVEEFRNTIKERIRETLDLDEGAEIPEEYLDEAHFLLTAEDEWECVAAYRDFSSKLINLTDFFDGFTSMEKTYHYIWCLYAIVFGVMAYDEATKVVAA